MSFNTEDLKKTVVISTTPDAVMVHTIREIIEDLRDKGMYETETSGLYIKAFAVLHEDSIMSFGKFAGEGDILND